MKSWQFAEFGLEHLRIVEQPDPAIGPGEVRVEFRAWGLNFRDLIIVGGMYQPSPALPAVPLSDAAGVVVEVGGDVREFRPGDRVVTHCIPAWVDGAYQRDFGFSMLGQPGQGVACDRAVLPENALVHMPETLDFAQAAALPVAGLTAWDALSHVTPLKPDDWVLALGTGGVSVLGLQFAKSLGAKVIVTSGDDDKLERARALGADEGINYRTRPDWDAAVLNLTGGQGAKLVLDSVGPATLRQSMHCAASEGTVAVFGVLGGLEGPVSILPFIQKRVRLLGINVGSRATFASLNRFIDRQAIQPIADARFTFEQLPLALGFMGLQQHFGKVVLSDLKTDAR